MSADLIAELREMHSVFVDERPGKTPRLAFLLAEAADALAAERARLSKKNLWWAGVFANAQTRHLNDQGEIADLRAQLERAIPLVRLLTGIGPITRSDVQAARSFLRAADLSRSSASEDTA